MWSGRFREPLDPAFESWQRSFPFDVRLLPQEVAASKAHARAISAAGILTDAELATMLDGLDRVIPLALEDASKSVGGNGGWAEPIGNAVFAAAPAIVALNPQAEDIHHFVELTLTRIVGDLALKLHTGRSRNEQIATDMRLFVRDAIDETLRGLLAWRTALVEQARGVLEIALLPAGELEDALDDNGRSVASRQRLPARLELAPGRYRLRLVSPAMDCTKPVTVTVRAGRTTSVRETCIEIK